MKMVTEITSKAMEKASKLEEKCFLEQFGKRAQLLASINYYSPCRRPDLVLGLKSHADGSGYTIILHYEAGLQVLKDGKWYTVPKDPTALLVLMGDQMERFTVPKQGQDKVAKFTFHELPSELTVLKTSSIYFSGDHGQRHYGRTVRDGAVCTFHRIA